MIWNHAIPRPPVPPRLREMLKDYPELIQRVQDRLDFLVDKRLLGRAQGVPMFEQAVWALEGTLDAMYGEANLAFEAAKAAGAPPDIEKTKKKRHAINCTIGDRSWNDDGEDSLWEYLQTHAGAFE